MKIFRFDISARVLHWSHASVFIWLLITGIWLFLSTESLLGDPLIRIIHLYASIPFVLLPGMLYISGSTSMHNDIKEFNSLQKANFMAMLLLIIGLSFSGFVVWMKSMFSVDFVELNFLIHDYLAILAILLLTSHITSFL